MNIKEYMLRKNLTYRDFAKILGISHGTVWYWAMGKTIPTPNHRRLIERKTKGEVNI
jgi:transcriptional regulator with XRE-family HTH domain